jgi:hypothetical protein
MLHNLGTHFSSKPFEQAFKIQGVPNRLHVAPQELSAAEIAAWMARV